MRQSIRIIKRAINDIPDGKLKSDHRKITFLLRKEKKNKRLLKQSMESSSHLFKLYTEIFAISNGATYTPVEAPKGEFGVYLISNCTNRPYRCKIRRPEFAHCKK